VDLDISIMGVRIIQTFGEVGNPMSVDKVVLDVQDIWYQGISIRGSWDFQDISIRGSWDFQDISIRGSWDFQNTLIGGVGTSKIS